MPDVTGQTRDVVEQKDADASEEKTRIGARNAEQQSPVFIPAYFSSRHANKFASLASNEQEAGPAGIVEANVSTRAHDYERRTPKELQQRKRGRPPRPMDKQSVPTPRQGKQHYRRPPQHEEGQQPGPKEHSAGRDNEDWMFSRERFHQLKKEHGPFTLDAAASADGSNAQCRDFCSAGDHSFLKRELRGETLFPNFPYGRAGEFLQQYVEQKANDPSNGGMFVLPQWKKAAWWPIVENVGVYLLRQ